MSDISVNNFTSRLKPHPLSQTYARYPKAVVLGAGGFIGRRLVHCLQELGFELVGFDRNPGAASHSGLRSIQGSFSDFPIDLLREMDDALVFHLISSSRPSQDTAQAVSETEDLATTIGYLEKTRGRNLRWIFVSSGGTVYGVNDAEKLAEGARTAPICSYGLLKLAIEGYFALYNRLYGTEYVVTRLANPYGPGQDPRRGQGVIAAMIYSALAHKSMKIWGDGTNIRDYIYIDDAVEGILQASALGCPGIYNIGTEVGLSLNDVAAVIRRTLDLRLDFEYSAARSVDVSRNVLDCSRLAALSRWRPQVSLEEGLRETAGWIMGSQL